MHTTIENKRWVDEICPEEEVCVKFEWDQELFLFNNICENYNEYLEREVIDFELEDYSIDLIEYQELLLKLDYEIQE